MVAAPRLKAIFSSFRVPLGKINTYLRTLLIHGARTALPGLAKSETPLGRWLKGLLERAHRNVAIVALANKLSRIAWAVLAHDRQYVAIQVAGD